MVLPDHLPRLIKNWPLLYTSRKATHGVNSHVVKRRCESNAHERLAVPKGYTKTMR